MARPRRLRRSARDHIHPPLLSQQLLTRALAGFIALIILFVASAKISTRGMQSNAAVSQSVNVYRDPSGIPVARLKKFDAILVLGGGRPSEIDKPPIYVQRRCDDAAAVVYRYKEISKTKSLLPILCLSAGTAHLPQLMASSGLPIWESTSSAAYLQKRHNLSSDVYVETTSYDTIGNAFFARTSHTDVAGWRRLLVVTSEFHMERTKAIFDWIFSLDSPRSPYQISYLQSPNVGLEDDALEARREKEAKSLVAVQRFAKQFQSMKQVWVFLNQQHDLYTASKLVQGGAGHHYSDSTELIKKSYGVSP